MPRHDKKPPTKLQPKAKVSDIPVPYPNITFVNMSGADAVREDTAKSILGWTEDPDEAKRAGLGKELFTYRDYRDDGKKKKVWTIKNIGNRPFYPSNMESLKQILLNKQWAGPNGAGKTPNGEPIIISDTGILLNSQHSLIALALANNELHGPAGKHWEEHWPDGEVVMDKLVVYGISEDFAVSNTHDTCKPRTIMDVIYRSDYFRGDEESERRKAAAMLDNGVRLLWSRLALKKDPFAPRRNHAEALDFIHRHQQLVKAVNHIKGENASNRLNKFFQPGYAVGMMYLMAASKTDSERYFGQLDKSSEEEIDFSMWKKAEEFWTLFINGKDLDNVRDAINGLYDSETGEGGSMTHRIAVLVKAWNVFKEDEEPTDEDLSLDDLYDEDEETGVRKLRMPTCGGIDLGSAQDIGSPQEIQDVEAEEAEEYQDMDHNGDEPPDGVKFQKDDDDDAPFSKKELNKELEKVNAMKRKNDLKKAAKKK